VTLPPAEAKAALRDQVRARRREREDRARADVEVQLAVRLGAISEIAALVSDPTSGCVAAYASYGTEPGTGRLRDLLELSGVRVVLPVIRSDGRLDFAWDTGTVGAGSVSPGIPEPVGPIAASDLGGLISLGCRVVLTPALAVDLAGNRLGKAGGYYDRLFATLDQLDAGSRPLLVAVVHDDDVVASVPVEAHDVAVDAVLTPTRYLVLR
jgi:5-formyltetrahydrofolate cyclo-ligase